MMSARVSKVNPAILRQCREQLGLSVGDVGRKVPKIAAIEKGDGVFPTYKQLDKLADLYQVPSWVFIVDHLPERYQFDATPSFRKFTDGASTSFKNSTVRILLARVLQFRDLVIEWREDADEPVAAFAAPAVRPGASADAMARRTREWLNVSEPLAFADWKAKVEDKGVFVFMSGKHPGWSRIDKDAKFRGLSVYCDHLPIVIINDADVQKAQAFTLMHELGHLLRKESGIDDDDIANETRATEQWCDEFAGCMLMPEDEMRERVEATSVAPKDLNLKNVKRIAEAFKVSAYACLVRLKQLRVIRQAQFEKLQGEMKKQCRVAGEKPRQRESGLSRNRPKEVLTQYGRIFSRTVFQAYHDNEINLHQLCRIFELKRASYALRMEEIL